MSSPAVCCANDPGATNNTASTHVLVWQLKTALPRPRVWISLCASDNTLSLWTNSTLHRRYSIYMYIKYHCSIDATKYYFSNRIVHIWNSLPNFHLPCHLSKVACWSLSCCFNFRIFCLNYITVLDCICFVLFFYFCVTFPCFSYFTVLCIFCTFLYPTVSVAFGSFCRWFLNKINK